MSLGLNGRLSRLALCAAAMSVASLAAQAATISGGGNGLTWTAQSAIVGVKSTATLAGGGNPIYLPSRPQKNGVVSLIMHEADGDFICSGSLLSDRRSIVTAGHCVSGGAGTNNPISTTAYFYGGPDDLVTYLQPGPTAIAVTDYFVNPDYTGEVIDQNDIAVLRLADYAPEFATSYGLYTGDLTGLDFNVAGYGVRSDTGGDVGGNLGPGRLREGDNRYDFRLGDAAFGGFFAGGPDGFFGTATNDFSYLSDFDNGLEANDASCLLAGALGAGGSQFCNLGRGLREVGVAGGDSGGPEFIDGRIASVTSYGLTFCPEFGDIDGTCAPKGAILNSSFGEFSGYVPIGIHTDFIRSAMVPEPASWALMIGGFGLMGAALRRRKLAPARI